MKEFITNIFNEKVKAPFHFASQYYLDKNPFGEAKYRSFSNSKEAEDEYQQLQKNKNQNKLNSLIELTSKSLKLEYNKKLGYLTKNLKRVFLLSILIIFNSFINLKMFGFSELNISIIILSSISVTIAILLLFNIQINILLDLYGYSSFYLFSMFESGILISLYILKIVDFTMMLSKSPRCKGQIICWKNKTYYFIIFFNIIIFIGILFLVKYTLVSFYEAFNILVLKQKTMVQKQMEINERRMPSDKIEFDDDNNINNESTNRIMNNSEYKLDTFDNLKTE